MARTSQPPRLSSLGSSSLGRLAVIMGLLAVTTTVVTGQEKASRPASGGTKGTASTLPGAPRLLPGETMIYVRIEDASQLREDMKESSVGRMMDDPKMRPMVSDVYNTVSGLFAQVGSRFGLTLDDLIAIPQGQVAFAVVGLPESDVPQNTPAAAQSAPASDASAPRDDSPEAIRKRLAERRQRRNPARLGLVMIIDTGDEDKSLDKILDQIEQQVERGGGVARSETIDGVDMRRWLDPDGKEVRMEYFRRGGATIIGIGGATATDALARWNGKAKSPSLSESSDFAAVMTRVVGASETRPQIQMFADPYRLLKRLVTQAGGVGGALGWQIAEELGVNKIRGIGASSFHGGETFDDISHAHILLDPPRDGIFSVLRPKDGDTNPPAWVPDDVTSFTSIGWRADATYEGVGRILDRFQGEGALKRLVEEPYKTRVGGDFRKSVIDAIDDRVILIRWLQPPVRVNSNVSINAIKLKDPIAFQATIDELRKAFPTAAREETLAGRKLYLFGGPRGGGQNGGGQNGNQGETPFPEGLRRPTPCAIVLDDWLLTSDSREFIERAIRTNDGAIPKLKSLPDYDVLASELGSQLDGEKPFMLSFVRSSEVLRQLYDLAKSDQTRSFLDTAGQNNPVVRTLSDLLKRNQLPPFDDFIKYFAPTGSFAYDEANGMHFGRYTLKPDEE